MVRRQTVVHHRESRFGEPIDGSTWVEQFRRGMFSTRQIHFEVDGKPLAEATQEWVHVSTDGGVMRASRASKALLSSFEEHPTDSLVELPAYEAVDPGPEHSFGFSAWFTWMDPLDHANHPAYVDWIDEAVSRVMHRRGLNPVDLVPVAEQVRFKSGVLAAEDVRVGIRLVGRTQAGDAVIGARITRPSGLCAEATSVRRMTGGADALVLALRGRS